MQEPHLSQGGQAMRSLQALTAREKAQANQDLRARVEARLSALLLSGRCVLSDSCEGSTLTRLRRRISGKRKVNQVDLRPGPQTSCELRVKCAL